ncbi:hypothetical protein ATANTOWER_016466 [Ataeniobius toweri]|uniref:Uncharacterized protein n=1 Tax=Ataeniobius toweri TaxID=208326 RepID=A0ABU7AG03_9TELE|nr:hypothetical protein [Ataeniobius toweri]
MVQNISTETANLHLPTLQIHGVNLLDKSNSNKRLCKLIFPVHPNKNSILNLFSDSEVNRWWTAYLKYPLSPKVKEILNKDLILTPTAVPFVTTISKQQTISFSIVYTGTFWENFQAWIFTKHFLPYPLKREDIIFGTTLRDRRSELILNNLLILAKYLIHSCKWGNRKPDFSTFKSLLIDNHLRTLKMMKSKKSIQLLDAYEELNLFDEKIVPFCVYFLIYFYSFNFFLFLLSPLLNICQFISLISSFLCVS